MTGAFQENAFASAFQVDISVAVQGGRGISEAPAVMRQRFQVKPKKSEAPDPRMRDDDELAIF